MLDNDRKTISYVVYYREPSEYEHAVTVTKFLKSVTWEAGKNFADWIQTGKIVEALTFDDLNQARGMAQALNPSWAGENDECRWTVGRWSMQFDLDASF